MITMARRGKAIALALGLLALFLFITSRNAGSHPRDMHSSRFKDTTHPEMLRPVLKEPAGKWDAAADAFQDQSVTGGSAAVGLKEQLESIQQQAGDLPAEGIMRKTPKKGNTGKPADVANDAKDKAEVENPRRPQDGIGAVSPIEEPVKEYDPAEGMTNGDLTNFRLEKYPQ
jgi:hypothetical protein